MTLRNRQSIFPRDLRDLFDPNSDWGKLSKSFLREEGLHESKAIYHHPEKKLIVWAIPRSSPNLPRYPVGGFGIDRSTLHYFRICERDITIKDVVLVYIVLVEDLDNPKIIACRTSLEVKRIVNVGDPIPSGGTYLYWVEKDFTLRNSPRRKAARPSFLGLGIMDEVKDAEENAEED